LPAFLSGGSIGLDSGFMGLQVSASAILAEMRGLSIPMSIQSIPTNSNNQDIVPMGTIAARMTRNVIELLFDLLAMEAIVLAQGIELTQKEEKKYSENAIEHFKKIRNYSKFLKDDRPLSEEISNVSRYLKWSNTTTEH